MSHHLESQFKMSNIDFFNNKISYTWSTIYCLNIIKLSFKHFSDKKIFSLKFRVIIIEKNFTIVTQISNKVYVKSCKDILNKESKKYCKQKIHKN